jgi:hypothetical protein
MLAVTSLDSSTHAPGAACVMEAWRTLSPSEREILTMLAERWAARDARASLSLVQPAKRSA